MKLQIAIDTADMEKVLGMVEKIHDVIDIVEVGTPVIMTPATSAALRKPAG